MNRACFVVLLSLLASLGCDSAAGPDAPPEGCRASHSDASGTYCLPGDPEVQDAGVIVGGFDCPPDFFPVGVETAYGFETLCVGAPPPPSEPIDLPLEVCTLLDVPSPCRGWPAGVRPELPMLGECAAGFPSIDPESPGTDSLIARFPMQTARVHVDAEGHPAILLRVEVPEPSQFAVCTRFEITALLSGEGRPHESTFQAIDWAQTDPYGYDVPVSLGDVSGSLAGQLVYLTVDAITINGQHEHRETSIQLIDN